MGRVAKQVLVAALLCAMAVTAALASKNSDTVTFPEDITVNGTMVKAGTYKLQFDDKSSELLVMNGKKVVAKAAAHLEKRDTKSHYTQVLSSNKDNSNVLTGIVFSGSDQAVVVGGGTQSGSM